jgi:hypothetical protein
MQNMKVENLKHPFILEAIVVICGQIFNKKYFFYNFFCLQKGQFVTEYSFFKILFAKWRKFIQKIISG